MPKRLLLADDSLTIHRVVELTFADEDFEVISVSNGNQAVEKINAIRPDIIIADVNMPEKDGYEVCAFVKNTPQLAAIPVLLLKGTFEPFNQEKAESVRADGIIQKPFQSQTLIDKVNNILGITSTPRAAAKTVDRVQAEKITQPQPPFLPKAQQPQQPASQVKDFMPFSHPSGQPPQAPPAPRPMPPQQAAPGAHAAPPVPAPSPQQGGTQFSIPGGLPRGEEARPRPPAAPKAPVIPPFPINQTAAPAQAPKPPQPVAPPVMPQQAPPPPMMPPIDDSPFGFTAVHQPQEPAPSMKSEDELSKDAFEAGKEIYQTFGESPSSPDIHAIGLEKESMDSQVSEWDQNDFMAEPPVAESDEMTFKPLQEESEANIPDFSDALSDVSMAFNTMMQKPEQKQDVPPVFEPQQPFRPEPVQVQEESPQWDIGIQPEMGKSGEMMFEPEALDKETKEEPYFSQYELEDSGVESFSIPEAKPEPAGTVPDLSQFDKPFIGEGRQMSVEKPDESVFQDSIETKSPATEHIQRDEQPRQQSHAGTDIDDLAERVASKIMDKISSEAIKEIAWELVPGIVEKVLREKMGKG